MWHSQWDTVLISSIFKKSSFIPLTLLLFGSVSCSSPSIDTPSTSSITEDVVPLTPITVGPIKPSKFFVDKTAEIGLAGVEATHFYAVDLNGNHQTDLVILPDHYSVPEFYYFNKTKSQYERYNGAVLPEGLRASYLGFYDFDKDGVLDLLMATLNQRTDITPQPIMIFKGELKGDKLYFSQVTGLVGAKPEPTAAVAVLDFDLDGKLDLFLANWFDLTQSRRPSIPDSLWRGSGLEFNNETQRLVGERFFDKGFEVFANARPSFGVSSCDIDQNGFPDIMVSSSSGWENKLWMNLSFERLAGRVFRNYGDESEFAQDSFGRLEVQSGGNSFFSVCTDYNNNGLIDLMVGEQTHAYEDDKRDRSSFLTGANRQFPPEFIRTEYVYDEKQTQTQSDRRGVFVDLDRDGLIDVLVDYSGFPPESRLISFIQAPDHSFNDRGLDYGLNIVNPTGTITLDLNQDGRMDIMTGQTSVREARIKPRLYYFENQLPFAGKRSLRFHLHGEASNAKAIGAKLQLITNEHTQTRFHSLQEGPQSSQNESGVFFGIGANNQVKELVVTWPILKNEKPLVVKYNLSKLQFERHLEVTLCESGKFGVGRSFRCSSAKGN